MSLVALTYAIAMVAATPAAHADILQLNGRNIASLFSHSGQPAPPTVPEPSSLILLATGALGLFARTFYSPRRVRTGSTRAA